MDSTYLENSLIGKLSVQDYKSLQTISSNDTQTISTIQTSSPFHKYFENINLSQEMSLESSPSYNSLFFPPNKKCHSQKIISSSSNISKWETEINTNISERCSIKIHKKSHKKISFINKYGNPNTMLTKGFPFVKKGCFIKKRYRAIERVPAIQLDTK